MLSTSIEDRIQLEFTNKKRMAWPRFCKHKKILINQTISLKSRFKFFDMCVTPTILFGLHCLPLPQKLISQLDVIQRKMLRAIGGWRRAPNETIMQMNDRILHGWYDAALLRNVSHAQIEKYVRDARSALVNLMTNFFSVQLIVCQDALWMTRVSLQTISWLWSPETQMR